MNADPSAPEATHEPSGEVSWGLAARVWWSLAWRILVFGGIAGGLLGFFIGYLMVDTGVSRQTVVTLSFWAAFVANIPIGISVVRHVLTKSRAYFRIVLIPKTRV